MGVRVRRPVGCHPERSEGSQRDLFVVATGNDRRRLASRSFAAALLRAARNVAHSQSHAALATRAAGRRLPDVETDWAAVGAPAGATETETLEATEVEERTDTPWRVVLYDDDIHTFEDVIVQLVKATGCTAARAEKHAWTVHTEGKDLVYEGEFFECFRVQGVLREIGLVTEIEG